MSDAQIKYELLVQEEDTLHDKIKTCEIAIDAVLTTLFKENESMHMLTVEDIITAIHKLEMNWQTELLHLRLEKFKMSRKIRQESKLSYRT